MRKTSEIIGSPPKTRSGHAVGCEIDGCQSYGDKTPSGYIYSKCVTHRILNAERSSRLGKTLCKSTKKSGGRCKARVIEGTDFCKSHHYESTRIKNDVYLSSTTTKAKVVEYPIDHPKAKNMNGVVLKTDNVVDELLLEKDIEKLRSICIVVYEEYAKFKVINWAFVINQVEEKEKKKLNVSKVMSKINVLQLQINKLKEELE